MDIKRISPQEAHELMGAGWSYVDVRTPEEFAEGHAAGAFNVPIALSRAGSMAPNPDFIEVMTKAFGKEAKVVVGCKTGGRSLRAAQSLLEAGFAHVVDQRAGWDGARNPFGQVSEIGWGRAGLPVETGSPAGRGYEDMKAKG